MRRFGLIGKTLKHSFSKSYFENKFEKEHITDCVFELFELPKIEDVRSLIGSFPDLKGFSITIPYKEQIIPLLHETDIAVDEAAACNCVKITNGKLKGYNTDTVGFRESLRYQLEPHHNKALILGTGGASKAVQSALRNLQISYQIVSRNPGSGEIHYSDLDNSVLEDHLLIVNATPVGTFPDVDASPEIPYQHLTNRHFLFDLVYNPPKTAFLAKGEMKGAKICNGYEMLVKQAEENWRIWNEG
jgi:shikimate dehydrogenase